MEKNEMETQTETARVILVPGFGTMSPEEAADMLATVERLNTENRELLAKTADTTRAREELENMRDVNNRLREEVSRLRQDIQPDDDRLSELWAKAYRYASSAGFCAEFERIADALGIPAQSVDFTGTALVDVTLRIAVPVYGTTNRHDVSDGNIGEDDINLDDYALVETIAETRITRDEVYSWDVVEISDVSLDD
jgi:hypothetical protein